MSSVLLECPNIVVNGGVFTKILQLVVGAFFVLVSILPGLEMRAAFSHRKGMPATALFRILLAVIGGLTMFEAAKLLLMCS